jgi:hypothetical protein
MGAGRLTDTRFICSPNIRTKAFPLLSFPSDKGDTMKKLKLSARVMGSVEYCWLLLTNPTFQAARDKRMAFYQYQVGKYYSRLYP